YGCSEVRGSAADTVENAGPGVPEAPAPVAPDLDSAYIDCTATPTGGGVEVHTVFVADNDLWHITLVRPDVPRTPEADAEALAGLHRIAAVVLSRPAEKRRRSPSPPGAVARPGRRIASAWSRAYSSRLRACTPQVVPVHDRPLCT